VVATADPLNVEAIEQLRVCYERPIKVLVTSPAEITKAINSIRTSLMSDKSSNLSESGKKDDSDDFANQLKIDVTDSDDDDAPIIRYVNAIIFKASSERASDVHIEPYEDKLKVRFRVDGVLYDVASEEKAFQAAIISRVKIMAGLNIAEKRLPQDGRIGLKIAGKDVDIRVSTVPTQFGERIVMRLLDKTGAVLDIQQLGVEKRNLDGLVKSGLNLGNIGDNLYTGLRRKWQRGQAITCGRRRSTIARAPGGLLQLLQRSNDLDTAFPQLAARLSAAAERRRGRLRRQSKDPVKFPAMMSLERCHAELEAPSGETLTVFST
jgi:hypothetical protein